MDESAMVFVMNAILFESRCSFPVPGLCELSHAAIRSVTVIKPFNSWSADNEVCRTYAHVYDC